MLHFHSKFSFSKKSSVPILSVRNISSKDYISIYPEAIFYFSCYYNFFYISQKALTLLVAVVGGIKKKKNVTRHRNDYNAHTTDTN